MRGRRTYAVFARRLLGAATAASLLGTLPAQAQPGAEAEEPVTDLPQIEVIGASPEALERIPGSGERIEPRVLETTHPLNVEEALRKVPGVHARQEDLFGQRVNIGIRGLDPSRSSRVLQLEDGIFVTPAPYNDAGTYFSPAIDRYESIEVLKGSGQILFGPQTVGAVVNYVTPNPPRTPGGFLTLQGGSRDFFKGQIQYGGFFGENGILFNAFPKQGTGSRDNTRHDINDFAFKWVRALGAGQGLTFRASYFDEDSRIGYRGLTEAEFRDFGRFFNPYRYDTYRAKRYAVSATHEREFRPDTVLTTNFYYNMYERDWFRQVDNTNTTLTPEQIETAPTTGRGREYYTYGVEPRLRLNHTLFGARSEADLGVRAHFERVENEQTRYNGPTPESGLNTGFGVGGFSADDTRRATAYAAYLQNRFLAGAWTITPGLRLEHVRYERNIHINGGAVVDRTNDTDLTELIPGLGATYAVNDGLTLFAGVHRGFAPPRTEDIIGGSGGTVDLDAEKSTNYEIGLRSTPRPGLQLDATLFRMDFSNQIIRRSIAAGTSGTENVNAGRTLHQGLELGARLDAGSPYLRLAYTYLPDAEFRGTRFSSVDPTQRTTGKRLPYAPEHLLAATVGYARAGWDAGVEAVYVGSQFSDDLNTVDPIPSGQRGRIGGHTLYNLAINYTPPGQGATFFLAVKNLTDKVYIVDRSRGILPGIPRLVQAGVRYGF